MFNLFNLLSLHNSHIRQGIDLERKDLSLNVSVSLYLSLFYKHVHTHMHGHLHIYTSTTTPTTEVLRASVPECGDAWKFSVGGGELTTATLGVLKVTPSSCSYTLHCIVVISSPNLQYIFVNCFILVFVVPWRIKGEISVHAGSLILHEEWEESGV